MSHIFETSCEYAANVATWCAKFNELLMSETYTAISILAYYLPGQCCMCGCPLGDTEFQAIGEAMRSNPAMFAAAETTGLLATGMDAFFYAALENYDNWCYYYDDIQYILGNDALRKFVAFDDRYLAEVFLSTQIAWDENDEDFWLCCYDLAVQKLNRRKTRGYAY